MPLRPRSGGHEPGKPWRHHVRRISARLGCDRSAACPLHDAKGMPKTLVFPIALIAVITACVGPSEVDDEPSPPGGKADSSDLMFDFEAIEHVLGNTFGLSMKLDGQERPHVVYDVLGHGLRYAVRDSMGWKLESIVSTNRAITHHDVALQPSGQPCVVFSIVDPNDNPNRMVRYVCRDPEGRWEGSDVDRGSGPFALTIDQHGTPHLMYAADSTTTAPKLKYATYLPGTSTWARMVVYQGSWGSGRITVDSSANPQIIFAPTWLSSPLGSRSVLYAKRSAGTFQVTEVMALGDDFVSGVDLAVDQADGLHLMYGNPVICLSCDPGDMNHTGVFYRSPGAEWETAWRREALDYLRMSYETTMGAHIVGRSTRLGSAGLQLGIKRHEQWQWHLIASGNTTSPNIALSPSEGIHLAYVSYDDKRIMYARRRSP